MLIQFIAILLMLIGLAMIIIPKFHGAVIILAGCVLYTIRTGFWQPAVWLVIAVAVIAAIAEFSVIVLARYLTNRYKIAPELSAGAAAGNIAGIIVSDALFGLFGTVAFETVVSKTLLPRLNTIGKVFVRMAFGALFRVGCGVLMIFLVLIYT